MKWWRFGLAAALALVATAAACSDDDARVEPPDPADVLASPSGPVPWSSATVKAVEAGPRSPTPAPTPVDTTSLPLCRASELKVSAKWQGANGGAIVGGLTFQNTAATPCYLAGRPGISLFRESGAAISASAPVDVGTPIFLSANIPGLPEESANYAKAITPLS